MRHYIVPAASVLVAFLVALGWLSLLDTDDGDGFAPGSELRIEGTVSHVRDGDTIEVGDVAVRLANLDCAESDTEAGRLAGERMAQLVQGEPVVCALEGRQSYDREVGTCKLSSTGQDVGEVLIVEHVCEAWEHYVPYLPPRQLHRSLP